MLMSLTGRRASDRVIKCARMYRYVKAVLPMLLIMQPIYNYHYNYDGTQLEIRINANRTRGTVRQFWRSTGLCPPDPKIDAYKFLSSKEEKINLALIGSLPNRGIRYVRIHWLLNLIQESQTDGQYNFTHLDNLIDHLSKYNLRPGFEIMGQPISSKPFNVTYKSNINWTRIVQKIALRYIDKYGVHEVKNWRFETWNEPDLKSYNILNFTLSEYLTYVDGVSKGLQSAFSIKKSIGKLGGPAGLFKDKHHHPLCWGILQICGSKNNTAKCPFNFISFHKKGDSTPEGLMNGTLTLLDEISASYPQIKRIPIANDEADLLVNWSKSEEWRADVRYASNVVNVIADYYKSVQLDGKWKIEALSNDNAFLNYHPFYFTQRTLFARFQMNETRPPHIQFIKKPVYSVMGMLSFLKGERLVKKDDINQDRILTILATKTTNDKQPVESSISILLATSNGTRVSNDRKNVTFSVNNWLDGRRGAKYVIYVMDQTRTNPYRVWKKFGKPVYPNATVRREMRQVEEPFRFLGPADMNSANIKISILMSVPSVALIHLCAHGENIPAAIHSLNIFNVTYNEILLTWKYPSNKGHQCIKTYEIEQKMGCFNEGFKRINAEKDTVFLSYHYHPKLDDKECEFTSGSYRVRAVDYWLRPGPYSIAVYYP